MEPVSPGTGRSGTVNRQRIGAEHEQQARHYLERAGLKWVASNVRFRGGELDLIMRDADCWVFVEVRYRRDARQRDASETAEAAAGSGALAADARRQF